MKNMNNEILRRYDLKLLSMEQIDKIYEERMLMDFPCDELKPLGMIKKLVLDGRYDCYGLFENDEMIGYTFLNRLDGRQDYLIDYLATFPNRRNGGLGAIMINLLREKLSTADSIIGEVENPKYANDESSKELQSRRFNFYLRNGFTDTNVRARCFGVPFIIIELGNKMSNSENEIKEIYKCHYKAMLPKDLYEKNVIV